MEGGAWLGEDGIRAAWFSYKACDETMLDGLREAQVNTVVLGFGFHDILDLESARWDDGRLLVEFRDTVLQRLLAATQRAADRSVHVLWMANYELEIMQPHLERLGYHNAYVEGPTRFITAGPKEDAAALDPTFWRHLTGAYGEKVAQLSLDYPIEGILFDTEHYAGGIMYLQGCGFADISFAPYLESRGISSTPEDVPAGTRYAFLKERGLLADYFNYLEEKAYEQGRYLAARWHAVNPHLILGFWVLYDSWFSQGFLRGLGGAVPVLGLSGVEYYHGSDQTRSMAEYFEAKNRNLQYMPGFYPPYAYSLDQLEYHVAQAIRATGHYWMLSPQKQLLQPEYQVALRNAYDRSTRSIAHDRPPVDLQYRIENRGDDPVLIVETQGGTETFAPAPRLTLRATFGGAVLCEEQQMEKTAAGTYQVRIPLVRCLSDNRYLDQGFRSGVQYQYQPVPREFLYADPHHTKLFDGRAYGFFGTTAAWSPSVDQAEVVFDMHRPYRITRVTLAQPTKLEDRRGGPTRLQLDLGLRRGEWERSLPFSADFRLSGSDYVKLPIEGIDDKRHTRAWLSWTTESIDQQARWLRIRLQRVHQESSISLGEVVIWGRFDGEVQAALSQENRILRVRQGKRYRIGAVR